MLTPDQEALLNRFRGYLEAGGDQPEGGEERVDLYTLFGELAALKNEVRIESRQVKGALDQFRALVEPLQMGHAALQEEIVRLKEEKRLAGREALRPLLLSLLDLRDRLEAGLTMSPGKRWHRRLFKRLCRKEQEMLDAWRTGQGMLLGRLDRTLTVHEVHPLDLVNRPLDPRLARAVRVERHKGVANGLVLAELRRGFLWHGELLRLAEVVVNQVEER